MSASGSSHTHRSSLPTSNTSGGTLDEQLSAIIHKLARDLWTCEPSIWLTTYAPHAIGSDDNFVENIIASLRANQDTSPVLDDEGWSLIREGLRAGKTEAQVFSHLDTITSRIVESAISLKPELGQRRNFTLKCSPRDTTRSEVTGWRLSDWRGIRRSPGKNDGWSNFQDNITVHDETRKSTRAPINEESSNCRKASDETADTAFIAGFRVRKSPGDIADVSTYSPHWCYSSCVTYEERKEDSRCSQRTHVQRPSSSLHIWYYHRGA